MKRYSILSLLFIFFALGVVAQVDSLILPFGATTLTDEQKASNPDYLAYPLMLASQMPEINCNQTTDCEGAVDLGLSVLWATHNVGAEKPEDYGDYFAWGETQPKENYDWTTYKYCKGTNKTMTKYCNNSSYGNGGFTDTKTVLDPEDDAATVNWGGSWRMPTDAEFTELREQCTWTRTTQNGVEGYKVVGKNGNSIFLPAAGYMDEGIFSSDGFWGFYWSSSLSTSNPNNAYGVIFDWVDVTRGGNSRFFGQSVRPVCSKKQEHEWVDLGLSVKWATCNVGAEKPEDYGDYFAWGETAPKDDYSWTTYKYCAGTSNTLIKYCSRINYGNNGFTDNKTVLDPEDDAATVNWGGARRMPTDAEMTELREKCTWTWITQNGVNGYKVVGPNGNSIFLPAAGYVDGASLHSGGSRGFYWSSSLDRSASSSADFVLFYSGNLSRSYYSRYRGLSVRPVCPKKQESIEYYDTVAICDGDPYFWEVTGETYYVAGDYDTTRTSQFGCDSIYHLYLMVGKIWLKEDTVNICDNEEYLWHNHYKDTVFRGLSVGQYVIYDSLKTDFFGCDSVYRLVINVYPTYYIDEGRDTICITELSEYKWERHEHKTFNFDLNKDDTTYILYDSLLTYFHACDSIHRLCLTVLSEKGCNSQSDCMEYVDLGLSVLWATCNVGASTPEDYGDYFAWGETQPKTIYNWNTYKYGTGYYEFGVDYNQLTKYCNNSSYGNNGFTDNKTVLDPEDDAATVNWGGAWRMPTDEEFTELREQCKWTWTTQNGVKGYKVVGPNGNSIFLPAAGYMYDSICGGDGNYWSSSLDTSYPVNADFVYFNSSKVYRSFVDRYFGHSIRPVCPKKQEHEWVDLGLSVKWATCNVGAEKPEDYGDYFAWGETTPKEQYDSTTYLHCKGTGRTLIKYCFDSNFGYNGFVDSRTMLDSEDDVAIVDWGGLWRMPTRDEVIELKEKCKWVWTTQNGVKGYQVVGPNGNSIFLPAAGYMSGTSLYDVGSDGYYWSSSLDNVGIFHSAPSGALHLYFSLNSVITRGMFRPYGQLVRPVCQ